MPARRSTATPPTPPTPRPQPSPPASPRSAKGGDAQGASILIRGGRVIDPASRTDKVMDVAVSGGVISAIGKNLPASPAQRVIDATGCIVTPGLIDPHVHLREPGQEAKETIASGTSAAVSGGFTSVCCMPNTSPALDTPEMLAFVHQRAVATGVCRVFPVAAATRGRKGEEPTEISLMASRGLHHGACAFSDDGDGIASAGVMLRVLSAIKPTGRAFMQHAQDPTLTRGASMHAGSISMKLGLGGWPRVAEEIMVERDVRLNASVGCKYHVQHISSAGTVEIIRRARKAGIPVSGEASPHHLLLTHEACAEYHTLAKVNPPLREKADAEALAKGLADGTITVLATDHAPHTAEEKDLPFEEAPFGLIALETALALYIEALITPGVLRWPKVIEMMTVNPAALCGLDALGLGRLAVGGPADVTVIDPDLRWTISPADLVGRSRNTPFLGRAVQGRSIATIVAGEVRHERPRG